MKERVQSQSFDWRKPAGITLATLMLGFNSCAPNNGADEEYTKTSPTSTETTDTDPAEIESAPAPSPIDLPDPGIGVDMPEPEPSFEPEPEPIETDLPIEIPTVEPVPKTQPSIPDPTESMPSDAIDCMVQKCIALTFDDGPGPFTQELLDDLDEYDAKATFFLVGNRVDEYQDAAIGIRDGGHQIGNHTWDHDNLTTKNSQAAAEDVEQTSDEIERVTGVRPTVMRPPYGATNQRVVDAVGQPQILWSVDTEDWKHHDSDYVANYVINNAGRGDIVLMHDIHKTSVKAVPEILEELSAQDYKFVTVDDLIADDLTVDRYSQQDLSEAGE